MYTFLMMLGTALVVYGYMLHKKDGSGETLEAEMLEIKTGEVKKEAKEEVFAAHDPMPPDQEDPVLEKMEPAPFQELLEREQEKVAEVPETDKKLEEERQRILEGLEKGDYSVDMVCSMFNMEKGEVLLLKNISKTYGN